MTSGASTSIVLQEPVLREIAERGNVKRYPAHTVLITEDDDADTLYIILSGRVKVYASNESGKDVILSVLTAGDLVGEMAIDGGSRSASAMTLEPTSCAVVGGADLRAFIVAHPDGEQHRIVTQKMTQQDIAEHVGSSREMVSRIFKELTIGGYITVEGGRIRVLKTPPAAW